MFPNLLSPCFKAKVIYNVTLYSIQRNFKEKYIKLFTVIEKWWVTGLNHQTIGCLLFAQRN